MGKGERLMRPITCVLYQYSTALDMTIGSPDDPRGHAPRAARYLLSAIRNRFKESVTFTYYANGVDFDAQWTAFGNVQGPRIQVRQGSISSGMAVPALDACIAYAFGGAHTTYSYQAPITISYQGVSNVSSYTLTAASSGTTVGGFYTPGNDMPVYDDSRLQLNNLQLTSLQVNATGETVSFSYGPGAPTPSYSYTVPGGSATFTSTFTPTVLTSVSFPGRTVRLDWATYPYMANKCKPNEQGFYPMGTTWTSGVVGVHDQDTSSGLVERYTQHQRVVPTATTGSTFTDTIFQADGTVKFLKFVELPGGSIYPIGGPAASVADQIQTLAFLKHLVAEERTYANASAYYSYQPFQVVVRDRYDLRSSTNPSASAGATSVPYPTRTQAWDRDTGVGSVEELTAWDSANFGWQKSLKYILANGASPTFDLLGLALSYGQPYYPTFTFDRSTTRTFGSDPAHGFWGRVTWQQTAGRPALSRTFNAYNQVTQASVGDYGLGVGTSYAYSNGSPPLQSATMGNTGNSQFLALSGQVGASYTAYDSYGFPTRIQPAGMAWSAGQSNDALGRPQSQSDANGATTQIGWDGAGRLNRIAPPDGDAATSITYNDGDHLGSTLTRSGQNGAQTVNQTAEQRYDGFGQLTLLRRYDGNGSTSHKVFAYDLAGRKTYESVWVMGYGWDAEGRNQSWTGGKTTFDYRGRPVSQTDANGIVTTFAYSGLTVSATTGPNTTTKTFDALGRLVKVTDALGQDTLYAYDDGDRITSVTQSGNGLSQVRSWVYNSLGWVTSLTQPESGTTTYDQFTVTGKPQSTNYAGRQVTTSFDSLVRPTRITSADGSVDQEFRYDDTSYGHGSSMGKLWYARDKGVETVSTFRANGGRLSNLMTNVWTGGALNTGTLLSFPQDFTYNGFGHRLSAASGQGVTEFQMEAAKELVQGVSWNGQTVASAILDSTAWTLTQLTYANGATSTFSYGPDQARVASMSHMLGSQTLAGWSYQYDPSTGWLTGDGEDRYGYDKLGRLTSATVVRHDDAGNYFGSVTQTMDYDAFGNAASSSLGGATPTGVPWWNGTSFSFSKSDPAFAKNQLPTNGATGAAYDAQGNLTQIYATPNQPGSLQRMSYDALGRVIQLDDSTRAMTETYAYTAEGLRTLVSTYSGTTLQKRALNLYNDARQLVSQFETPAGAAPTLLRKTRAALIGGGGGDPRLGSTQASLVLPTGPLTVGVGQAVVFQGSSRRGDSYTWTFGDGFTTSDLITSHAYGAPGTYTATLTARDSGRDYGPFSGRVRITGVPVLIRNFSVSATSVSAGGYVTFYWSVPGANSLSLNGTNVTGLQSQSMSVGSTRTFTLTASNAYGSSSRSLTVSVVPSPQLPWIGQFIPSLTTLNAGQGSVLNWNVGNATSVTLNGVPVTATSQTVYPTQTTQYTLSATNGGGTVSQVVTISVNPTYGPQILAFGASTATADSGQAVTLSWAVNGAGSVYVNGSYVSGNSLVVRPTGLTKYTLQAWGNGTSTATIVVAMTPPGGLTWKRDLVYMGSKEVAEMDPTGLHVTQVDHLGSPRFVTNGAGAIEARQKFLPFGETLEMGGTYALGKGFTGHEQTDPSRLIYMQGRYYTPQYHRFLSPDPARDQHFEETQSWNIYSYVRNNPTMLTDPTGMIVPTYGNGGMMVDGLWMPYTDISGGGGCPVKYVGQPANQSKLAGSQSEGLSGPPGQLDTLEARTKAAAIKAGEVSSQRVGKLNVFVYGGSTEDRAKVLKAISDVFTKSSHGATELQALESRKFFLGMGSVKPFDILLAKNPIGSYTYTGSQGLVLDLRQVGAYSYVFRDPISGFSLQRIIAHELGHAAMGTSDDGPMRMNNVNKHENVIMRELGDTNDRVTYD